MKKNRNDSGMDTLVLPSRKNSDTLLNAQEGAIEAQAELQQRRDLLTACRRKERSLGRYSEMMDCITEAAKGLKPFPHVSFTGKTGDTPSEAVMLISDLHIGADCDNFYNKYNCDIAYRRLMHYVNSTIAYCHENKVQKLNVINLGDLVNGIIHTSSRIESTMDVADEVIKASEMMATALSALRKAAPEVCYRSCLDNHSRIIANLDEAVANESFVRIIDWYLKERLKNTSIIFKDDNLDNGIGRFSLLNGKTVMFAHGHQDNINQAFQHFVGATRHFVEYIVLGHYHCPKVKDYQGTKVIVNGSVVGTEDYALSKRLFTSPSQTLLIFKGNDLLSFIVDLSDEK